MKKEKYLIYMCLFFLCILIIMYTFLLITRKKESIKEEKNEQAQQNENTNEKEKQQIDYKANKEIRLKITATGEVIGIDINDYLRSVVASEMPADYDIEALKAQAIVARTYLYRKIADNAEGDDADVCDSSSHCQAYYTKEKLMELWEKRGRDEKLRLEYWAKINEAVVSTENEIIEYEGEIIKAFFHASSPVATESVDQIWGGIYYPYLVSVSNTEDEMYSNRYSNVEIDYSTLESKIKENIDPKFCINNLDKVKDIHINEYTTSSRVKNITVGNECISAEKLRTMFGLKSTMFTMEITDSKVIFNVVGYGHGIGMSQVGANYLAKNGYKCEDIVKYYYTGVNIVSAGS